MPPSAICLSSSATSQGECRAACSGAELDASSAAATIAAAAIAAERVTDRRVE